jgi:PAS domain S-box-containing protein
MKNRSDKKKEQNRSFEQRYKTLLTAFNTFESTFIMDRDGTILEANKAFAARFSMKEEDCIGKNAYDLVPPQQAADRRNKVDEALRTGKTLLFDGEQDGSFKKLSFMPIADSEGKMTQLCISRQDITELSMAEKEAKKQQIIINALVEYFPGAFYMLDAAGRFVQWNAYERDVIVGKKESEMPDTLGIDTIHPDDRQRCAEQMRSLMETGNEESAELRALLRGGPEFCWLKLAAKRIFLNGNPYLIGIANDFTEHKLAEDAALQTCENRFKTLFEEHSAVKLVIEACTANIIDANQAAADFFGRSIEKLCSMNMSDIQTTPSEKAIVEILNSRLTEKHPIHLQHRMEDGTLRDIEAFTTKIHIDGKDLFFAIIHDVTDRTLAEVQLKKMSTAVEQSPVSVVITDPLGHMEYVNPMFTQLTGYSAEEVKGKNLRIFQSGLMVNSVYEDLWQTLISGNIWQGELYSKKKNGDLFWEYAVISSIKNAKGVITNFVAVIEDIMEQKQIHNELVTAKEKAEEADRLKSAFLATITHELRSPMNGILGFSELLKDPELSQQESSEYIDLIYQSGVRLLRLINELIDIARIEAGESVVQQVETNINQLMHDLAAFFRMTIHKKGLDLTCTTSLPDSESSIYTDSTKLIQILTNLINNSLKFTFQGGIAIGYTLNNGIIEFSVKDTGIGIPVSMQEKIFDRFVQVDNPLTRYIEGSGLGLSIAKAYVIMLGGTIRVASVEGRGSTFFFTLPYNPTASS